MKKYYITWQPEVAEAGHYFLTVVESDSDDLAYVMQLAHDVEQLDVGPYDLCSVISTSDARVVY